MFLYWQLCCLNNSLSQLALLFSTAVQTFRDVSLLAAVLFKQQVVSGPFLTVLFQQQLRYLEMFYYWRQSCLNNRLSTVPLLTFDSMAVQIFRDVSLMAAVLFKQQVVHCPYPNSVVSTAVQIFRDVSLMVAVLFKQVCPLSPYWLDSMAVQMFSDVSLLAAVLFKQQVVTVPFLTVLFQQQLRCLEMFHYWQLCCLNNSLSQLALLFSTAVQMLRHVSLQAAVLFKQQVLTVPFLTVLFQQQLRCLEMFHYMWLLFKQQVVTVPIPALLIQRQFR